MGLKMIHLTDVQFEFVDPDSSVGIATRYGLEGPGTESRWWWGGRFSAPVHTGSGAIETSYTMSTVSLSGIKRPGCGVDYLLPSSVKERV